MPKLELLCRYTRAAIKFLEFSPPFFRGEMCTFFHWELVLLLDSVGGKKDAKEECLIINACLNLLSSTTNGLM